jgi:hypothetical protein
VVLQAVITETAEETHIRPVAHTTAVRKAGSTVEPSPRACGDQAIAAQGSLRTTLTLLCRSPRRVARSAHAGRPRRSGRNRIIHHAPSRASCSAASAKLPTLILLEHRIAIRNLSTVESLS